MVKLETAAAWAVAIHAICHRIGLTGDEHDAIARSAAPAPGGWPEKVLHPARRRTMSGTVRQWNAIGYLAEPDPEALAQIVHAIDTTAGTDERNAIEACWTRRATWLRKEVGPDLRRHAHARITALRHALATENDPPGNEAELVAELVEVAEAVDQRNAAGRARRRLKRIGGPVPWRGAGVRVDPEHIADIITMRERSKRQHRVELTDVELLRDTIEAPIPKPMLAEVLNALDDLDKDKAREPARLHADLAQSIERGLEIRLERLHRKVTPGCEPLSANAWKAHRCDAQVSLGAELTRLEHLLKVHGRSLGGARRLAALVNLLTGDDQAGSLVTGPRNPAASYRQACLKGADERVRQHAEVRIALFEIENARIPPDPIPDSMRERAGRIASFLEHFESPDRHDANAVLEACRGALDAGAVRAAFDLAAEGAGLRPEDPEPRRLAALSALAGGYHRDVVNISRRATSENVNDARLGALETRSLVALQLRAQAAHSAHETLRHADDEFVQDKVEMLALIELAEHEADPNGHLASAEQRLLQAHAYTLGPREIAQGIASALRASNAERTEAWCRAASRLAPQILTYARLELARHRTRDLNARSTDPQPVPGHQGHEGSWTNARKALAAVTGDGVAQAIAHSEEARVMRGLAEHERELAENLRKTFSEGMRIAREGELPVWHGVAPETIETMLATPTDNTPSLDAKEREINAYREEITVWAR